MATTINAGRVAMVPKGEWDASTAYVRLDMVLYNGSSWVAIADSTGQVPAEGSTYWQLLASGVDIANYYTKSQVDGKMAGKQDTRLEVEFTMSTDIGSGVVTYTASKSVAEVMAAMQDGRDIIGKMGQGGMISDNYDYYHIFADKYNALLWGRLTNDASIEFFVQQQSALTRHVIALQERLVSGTNIKTVNNESLLGSGNVTIAAGEDGKSAYQSYLDTTSDNPPKSEAEWVASLKGEDGVDLGEVAIADNLTTDDATKVLSAKQGYVLKGLIDSQLITVSNGDLEIGDEDGCVLVRFADGEIETKNFNSATTPKSDTTPEIDTADEGDFELSDENGKVLMRLENGHIKVKNFNSEEIEISNPMLDKFKGLKLGIIGDSISTYNGWLPSSISGYDGSNYVTYYPSGDVNAVSKTWWYKAAEMLGLNPSTDINNCAWSGCQLSGDSTSTTSAKVGCSTRRVTDLAARGFTPDIILVFISCNDWRNNVAVGTWAVTDAVPAEGTITTMRAAYALLLNKIHTTYPSARVFCCTNLDDPRRDATQGYPSNNGNGVTTSQWNDNIKEIAEAFGCDVINMHNCGLTYQNMASFATDGGTHPNAAGMAMMARKAASELIAKY